MRRLFAVCSLSLLASCASRDSWPQAAGPHANWIAPEARVATTWSVARGENILWTCALPSSGQGGIAVVGDRIYLTTFPEQDPAKPRQSNAILCHAVDRATGAILWSRELRADHGRTSPQMYAFSDSTSWSPVASHDRVWFFNSSGSMACFTRDGDEVWRRAFRTQPDAYPFNRQCEPIAVGEYLVTIEPIAKDHPRYHAARDDWNYLHAIDRATGKVAWISEDSCTFYCTPVLGPHGILIGRGGPHDVPERPIGLSMIDPANGKRVWSFEPDGGEGWEALYTLHSDERFAYWFRNGREQSHLVIDAKSGALVREQSLSGKVDLTRASGERLVGVALAALADLAFPLAAGESLHVHPQWHTNIVANGWHWFLCTTNNRRNGFAPAGHSGPAFSLGRVQVETGRVEFLELPVGVAADGTRLYGKPLRTKTVDARGVEIADEDRSRTDGWEIDAFFPTPVQLGSHLYFTTMLGTVYVVDAAAPVLDARALVAVNDLGPLGDCWSMSGPSAAGGVLYHRSARELVAIGTAK
jgi:outer membrane protein assembly factor BamB